MTARKVKRSGGAITAWSASRLSTFEACARIIFYQVVKKMRLPPKPAMARGTAIHQLGEDYLKGTVKELPSAYKYYAEPMMELRRAKATPEQELAFDATWQPTTWTAPDVWVRMKIDATVLKKTKARAIDFKTGREYAEKHADQLELYALALFAAYPGLKTVEAAPWYLDLDREDDPVYIFRRSEEMGLRGKWAARAKKLTDETEFKANPSFRWCKQCGYNKRNGGPCTDGI